MSKSSLPLTIVAITTAAHGKEDDLRAAQQKLVEETVKESGCLRYELHQSLEDRRVLVFVESWESDDNGGPTCRARPSSAFTPAARATSFKTFPCSA